MPVTAPFLNIYLFLVCIKKMCITVQMCWVPWLLDNNLLYIFLVSLIICVVMVVFLKIFKEIRLQRSRREKEPRIVFSVRGCQDILNVLMLAVCVKVQITQLSKGVTWVPEILSNCWSWTESSEPSDPFSGFNK